MTKSNKNHARSPIAEFHRQLAKDKGWDIDQFANRIATAAHAADHSATRPSARVDPEYVRAMLYGRRPMSERWDIRIAAVLKMPLAEYVDLRTRVADPTAQSGSQTPGHVCSTPILSWPHLSWSLVSSPLRKIAVRLYGLNKIGLAPRFHVEERLWEPPPGFSEYSNLRDHLWQEVLKNFVRMKKEPINPKPVWHVKRIRAVGNGEVALDLLRADYRDILVTGSLRGLDHPIHLDSGTGCTVREWLASHWRAGNNHEPVLPGSRHLVVNLMVLTREGTAVISRQGTDSLDSAGQWVTSVSTVVNPKIDTDSGHTPDLCRAASRGCKEELGMDTDGQDVKWLTLAAGFKYGSMTFFGLLESQWSEAEIRAAILRNVQMVERDPTRPCEVVDVEFIEVSPEAIVRRLKSHDYRPYLELGFALLLWRKGEAEFTEGVHGSLSQQ